MKYTFAIGLLFGLSPLAHAAGTQVGDLRLSSGAYSGAVTYFDPASGGDLTRAVVGAPVGINSNFIAVTQNPDGGAPSITDDIGVQTFSASTQIRTLNRFGSDQDGPGAGGGPQRVGGVQWTIDLSPLNGYLTGNSLDLTALDLNLVNLASDDTKEYDIYLSYTNVAESITLAALDTGLTAGDENYDNFWFPAQGIAEGSVANGTHKVIKRDFMGDMTGATELSIDLLALYDAGITDINLMMVSGAFYSGRTMSIEAGSGIFIDTVPVPEPGVSVLGLLGALGLLRRRR
jgi:hypothetical protein